MIKSFSAIDSKDMAQCFAPARQLRCSNGHRTQSISFYKLICASDSSVC